jgi:hypothetical protein
VPDPQAVVDRERRWALPTALATLAAIVLLVVSGVVISSVSGDGEAEVLRAAHEHSSDVIVSSVLQALAFLLLAAPLLYLFYATAARTPKVRMQLVGLVVATPLFFAAASILNAVATDDAASTFVAGKATTSYTANEGAEDCREEQEDDADAFREDYGGGGGALKDCASTKVEDEKAVDEIADAPTQMAATGLGLGGRIGLAFVMLFCCLWAMRVGLLSRFWGSLGMALGAAALLLLVQFTMIWFLYFALLVAGWVPGGRPPAWAAGKAVPWPTPGERAAAELEEPQEAGSGAPPEGPGEADPPPDGGARRKRKQRD